MFDAGRTIVFLGIALIVIGGVVLLLGRVGLPLGRLPGDIVVRWRGKPVRVPITSTLLLSLLLTLLGRLV